MLMYGVQTKRRIMRIFHMLKSGNIRENTLIKAVSALENVCQAASYLMFSGGPIFEYDSFMLGPGLEPLHTVWNQLSVVNY
ncbi:hypothetical protein KC19_8G188000 [Ceratodon purpureus]|uniref:Uncharacterized protein n=1 Tax=Ceratodon purpureus TaxID=3225 RepID=A0A8T0H500_CERPU|nr:hypothetical protein KC19_8G188000 [Ceratodon purpureus]